MLISPNVTPKASQQNLGVERVCLRRAEAGAMSGDHNILRVAAQHLARTATSRARQLSSPPEILQHAALAACSSLAGLGLDAQNQLAPLGAGVASCGTNGVQETGRISAAAPRAAGQIPQWCGSQVRFGINVVLCGNRRSRTSGPCVQLSHGISPANGAASASRLPFSATDVGPQTSCRLGKFSPWPASA